jgi:hypothetical protein
MGMLPRKSENGKSSKNTFFTRLGVLAGKNWQLPGAVCEEIYYEATA